MSIHPFRAELSESRDPQAVVVILHGEINAFAEHGLQEVYAEAEAHARAQNLFTLCLDFSDVEYINSTGIALIVGLLAQARKSGIQLVVYGLSDHYQEIFTITRLTDFMTVYPGPVQ